MKRKKENAGKIAKGKKKKMRGEGGVRGSFVTGARMPISSTLCIEY
jgi:hypothetical protein